MALKKEEINWYVKQINKMDKGSKIIRLEENTSLITYSNLLQTDET